MKLCDNITLEIINYTTQYKLWTRNDGYLYFDKYKCSKYLLAKYWCKDQPRAEYLYDLLKDSRKYSKVNLSKSGCVFATRKIN